MTTPAGASRRSPSNSASGKLLPASNSQGEFGQTPAPSRRQGRLHQGMTRRAAAGETR